MLSYQINRICIVFLSADGRRQGSALTKLPRRQEIALTNEVKIANNAFIAETGICSDRGAGERTLRCATMLRAS